MVKVRNIEEMMELYAPEKLKEEWDNTGLLVGNKESVVSGILLALDLTSDVIDEAESLGCNLIITHHPLILNPLKKVVAGDPVSDMIISLISANISFFCAHTNLDKTEGGVNDCLAEKLGLIDITDLGDDALCRIGTLPSKMTMEDFALRVKSRLACECVKYSGRGDKLVKTVALCSGSGSDFYVEAAENGADVFVTGEVKHHAALYAEEMGVSFVEAGHFETENIVLEALMDKLTESFNIPVFISEKHTAFLKSV